MKIGLILLVSCFTASVAGAANHTVRMTNELAGTLWLFRPTVTNIQPGDSITWTNTHNVGHDSTAGVLDSGDQNGWASGILSRAAGDLFTFTFANSGNYPYRCMVHADSGAASSHPEQTGLVMVASAALPPSVTITNPTNGQVFFPAPASFSFAANATDTDGTISNVEFFNNTNSLFVDTNFSYSVNVTSLAAGSYTFRAVATDNSGLKATNSVSFTVNAAPSILITSPTDGNVFLAPASFAFSADASDTGGGTITQVQFFTNNVLAGTDTSSPYSTNLLNLAAGAYTLRAEATDNHGTKATNSVNITVNPNAPPTVAITNPATGAAFVAGATVGINVAAADADGSVSNVTLFTNGAGVGTLLGPNFNFIIGFPLAGNFALTAVAMDNLGLQSTSAPVNIFILTNAALTNFTTLTNGSTQFQVIGITDQTYFIDASSNLVDWVPIATNVAPGTIFPVTDSGASAIPYRFYRARQMAR